MGLMDLLQQALSGNAETHFDQVAQQAPPEQLGAGLAAAMRSDQTPPFGHMVSQMFGQSSPAQQAGVLNQILAALGPAAATALAGCALLGLAAPLAGETWPAQLSPTTWWGLGFQTVVVTFASYLLWFWLMRHYPATAITSFTLLTPLFGLLAGVWLLNEPLTLRLGVACAAVVLGIALVNRAPRAAPG